MGSRTEPESAALRRLRLALLAVGAAFAVVVGAVIVAQSDDWLHRALVTAAVIALCARWLQRAGRRDPLGWHLPEGAATLAIALARAGPVSVEPLFLIGMVWAGLSRSVPRLVGAGLTYGGALVVAAAFTEPAGAALSLGIAFELALLGATGGFVHYLVEVMDRGERSLQRERALSRLGPELVVAADPEEVRAAAERSVRTLLGDAAPTVRIDRSSAGTGGGELVLGATPQLTPEQEDALRSVQTQAELALERVGVAADLRRREARFRSLLRHASDFIVMTNAQGSVIYYSPAAGRVLGTKGSAQLFGASLVELAHPQDVGLVQDFLEDLLAAVHPHVSGEWRWRDEHGEWVPIEVVATNRLEDPDLGGLVLNCRDVRERRALEERLAHQALHDPLTGLGNRVLLTERLEHALARARRQHSLVGMVLLDLDNFKHVNDSLGHDQGDQLLVVLADRLRPCLRAMDTAARFGGDEFAVVLEDLMTPRDAEVVVERILERLATPVILGPHEVFASASAGIAFARAGRASFGERMRDVSAGDLMRHADVAMYAAKADGRARYKIFQPGMQTAAVERLELTTELQRAIERRELSVQYQPIIALDNLHVVGMEALVRWQHPFRGGVRPDDFVHLAEDSGLIIPMGRWVLERAVEQLVAWHDAFPADPPLQVAVNLSSRQVADAGLIADVADILSRNGLPEGSLVLEMTEGLVMDDTHTTRQRLSELRGLGAVLSIDDFGTGYSSLAYLRRFPVDILKIDKSFVRGLGQSLDESALVQAIVKLGRALGLRIVAEGIETDDQLSLLQGLGCDLGQGYFISRPMDPDAATRWLAEYREQVVDGVALADDAATS